MLRIAHPPTYLPERAYIHGVVLGEFLGLDWRAEICNTGRSVRITLDGDASGKAVTLEDVLFHTSETEWLNERSLPTEPVEWGDVPEALGESTAIPRRCPVLYGRAIDGAYYRAGKDGWTCGVDIFGTVFFMLSRYEELVVHTVDDHGRFPSSASVACRGGFLERPIVNEYVEILWLMLRQIWPGLRRKTREHRVLLSHDVDEPLAVVGRRPSWILRNVLADMAIRRDVELAVRRIRACIATWQGVYDSDPCNTFNFVMDVSERYGRQSAFYYLADRSSETMDGAYVLQDPWIKKLMRKMHERGHEIGLHPSYNTYLNPVQTRKEFANLRRVCAEAGIEQSAWGGRQHYLRWRNPTTWRNWATAGLSYDSTLGFPDRVGFRAGTCYEYWVFDLEERRALPLRERPLVVMEVTLLVQMRLSLEEAFDRIMELNRCCRLFGGDFTLLWHNSTLISRKQREWYRVICDRL